MHSTQTAAERGQSSYLLSLDLNLMQADLIAHGDNLYYASLVAPFPGERGAENPPWGTFLLFSGCSHAIRSLVPYDSQISDMSPFICGSEGISSFVFLDVC